MKQYVLDCRRMTDKAEAHAHIKSVLGFPEHYGANLDALHDCLGELGECTVRFEAPWCLAELGDYALKLLAVFRAAAEEGSIHIA
ncbi:MAG: barstar family protein [Oscillospiraceae bacterium]|nr:barstar family protein [Oscillospiraceae bacterium]